MPQVPVLTREEIYRRIVSILSESFEIEPSKIRPDATLYEELDLDSIDAIDIFTQLREITGRRPDPNEARAVRTVEELVDFVLREIDRTNSGIPEPALGPTEKNGQASPSA
ncbi:MAG: acyl carrier protein [Deltaproteobacteria bacterium]|nr:acyl carrier protein [Sandaracinaceae bacterium]MCX7807576.1 acyl carrier protein [Deltaproteobacteria bacterium]MDW8246183.1 acyl carrier protein [Sandaracinaceae bacterium]